MRTPIEHYRTLVFDCDGVILDSNKLKTRAFYLAALPYGEKLAEAMVDYHVINGGVSRYEKFSHFVKNIVKANTQTHDSDLRDLLSSYTSHVKGGLLSCGLAEGLLGLRKKTLGARWLVVSGGDQDELRSTFAARGIAHLFDGGIFGSPQAKDEILERECASGNISHDAVFIGDSKYDYSASSARGLDFVFVSDWTEFSGWQSFFREKDVLIVKNLSELSRA